MELSGCACYGYAEVFDDTADLEALVGTLTFQYDFLFGTPLQSTYHLVMSEPTKIRRKEGKGSIVISLVGYTPLPRAGCAPSVHYDKFIEMLQ